MFIEVTDKMSDDLLHINIEHVVIIGKEPGGDGTVLLFNGGQKIIVKETPDEVETRIDTLLT